MIFGPSDNSRLPRPRLPCPPAPPPPGSNQQSCPTETALPLISKPPSTLKLNAPLAFAYALVPNY